jgi:small subunit ribosomal protein S13
MGIGRSTASRILREVNIAGDVKVKDLTNDQIATIRQEIEKKYTVEGALRSEKMMNLKRLTDISSYRGMRHRRGLPLNGQRTRTNARTRKGPRKTVANRKKAPGPR